MRSEPRLAKAHPRGTRGVGPSGLRKRNCPACPRSRARAVAADQSRATAAARSRGWPRRGTARSWRVACSTRPQREPLVADHELTRLMRLVAKDVEPGEGVVDAFQRQLVEVQQVRRCSGALPPADVPR
eukprot:8824586-Pyramimonas_sp.AAC.1